MISIARWRNWLSEMSRRFFMILIWRRPESIVRLRKIGCVNVKLRLVVYCGLSVTNGLSVVARLLSKTPVILLPCHGVRCVKLAVPTRLSVLPLAKIEVAGVARCSDKGDVGGLGRVAAL